MIVLLRNLEIQNETVGLAIENGVKNLVYLNLVWDVGSMPDKETIMARCAANTNRDNKKPLFGDFTIEENEERYGKGTTISRERRFVFTPSFLISALVGFLISTFAGAVVYGTKVVANIKTKKTVAAEASHPIAIK